MPFSFTPRSEIPPSPLSPSELAAIEATLGPGIAPAPSRAEALPHVAIIGGGAMALYTLHHLISEASAPLRLSLFERGTRAGPGTPYCEDQNTGMMLSNIASREIPPLGRSLLDWLKSEDFRVAPELSVPPGACDETTFFPRVVLGSYFAAQLSALMARGRARGHVVEVLTKREIVALAPRPEGIAIDWTSPEGSGRTMANEVVLATGHIWPTESKVDAAPALVPWPASRLQRLEGSCIGILGSSLSGLDVALTIAAARGSFSGEGPDTAYRADPSWADFRLVLLSRKGILPEADYWYDLPLPEVPRLAALAEAHRGARGVVEGLLAQAWPAFRADLAALDPAASEAFGGPEASPAAFAAAYFAPRLAADPMAWARDNLAEAAEGKARRAATPWRQALLRGHEIFERLTPLMSEEDLAAFRADLAPVFTDCYACIPHQTIHRLLALAQAGHVEVRRTGAEYSAAPRPGGGARLEGAGWSLDLDVLVDARGQQRKGIDEIGIAGLSAEALAAEPLTGGRFELAFRAPTAGHVQCLAMSVLLERYPFAQGLVNCDAFGAHAAAEILARTDAGIHAPIL